MPSGIKPLPETTLTQIYVPYGVRRPQCVKLLFHFSNSHIRRHQRPQSRAIFSVLSKIMLQNLSKWKGVTKLRHISLADTLLTRYWPVLREIHRWRKVRQYIGSRLWWSLSSMLWTSITERLWTSFPVWPDVIRLLLRYVVDAYSSDLGSAVVCIECTRAYYTRTWKKSMGGNPTLSEII